MPLLSYGTKGPSGVHGVSGWICTKCNRVLSRRDALRVHSIKKHAWCIDTNAPVSPEAVNALKLKTQRRAVSRPDSADETKSKTSRREPHVSPVSQPLVCPTCDETFATEVLLTEHCLQKHSSTSLALEKMIFGDVCDISSSDGEATETPEKSKKTANRPTADDQVDVEPDDFHPEASKTQIPTECKTGQLKRSILTNWSATPKPVSETDNPCERKKLQLKNPPCPVKRSTVQAEQKTATASPQPSTSKAVADGSSVERLFECTKTWPARATLPSVRDIIAFRNTVPPDTTPLQIGQLTGLKFGWQGRDSVTSERYVQGVIAGHDHARRALLDDLQKFIKTKFPSATEAFQQRGWLAEWLETQPRPSTPNQLFED